MHLASGSLNFWNLLVYGPLGELSLAVFLVFLLIIDRQIRNKFWLCQDTKEQNIDSLIVVGTETTGLIKTRKSQFIKGSKLSVVSQDSWLLSLPASYMLCNLGQVPHFSCLENEGFGSSEAPPKPSISVFCELRLPFQSMLQKTWISCNDLGKTGLPIQRYLGNFAYYCIS